MARKTKEREYYGGRIKGLAELACKLVLTDPAVASDARDGDYSTLHARLAAALPGYGRRGECFNCTGSMAIAVYTAGISEALLLLAMARLVRGATAKGTAFTEANLVHVPTLATTDATRHAVTRASYLGLVKQPDTKRGSGYWVITHWGWKLLHGEPVPAQARYWRGKLMGRSEGTTTLSVMFKTHTDLIERALARRAQVKSDYRAVIRDWNPNDWVGFGGYIQDELGV